MSPGVPHPGEGEVTDPGFGPELDRAEEAFERGAWADARDRFLTLLEGPVLQRRLDGRPLRPGDFHVCHRAADLALLFQRPDGAADALAAIEELQAEAGRLFTADYAAVRRVAVLVAAARLDEAENALNGRLSWRFGHGDDLPEDLSEWEAGQPWPDADRPTRAVLYTGYYYAAGRYFAARGHYRRAAALLRQGLRWAAPPSAALACRARCPLLLALAGVLIEQGEFDRATGLLAAVRVAAPAENDPATQVGLLEEEGRRALFGGEYGRALTAFRDATEVYRRNGLIAAMRDALLNEAEVLVLLNQVTTARELLAEARALPPDADAAARIARIVGLAAERTGLPLADLAAPPVTRLQRKGQEPGGKPAVIPPPSSPEASGAGRPPSFLAWFDRGATAVRRGFARSDPAAAARAIEELRAQVAGSDSPLIAARLRALEGEAVWHAGRFHGARQILDEAVAEFDRIGAAPEAWQAVRYLAACADRLGLPAGEQDRLTADSDGRLDRLSASLSPAELRTYLLNKWTVQERRVWAQARAVQAARDAVAAAPWYVRPWRRVRFWQQLADLLGRLDEFKRDRPRGEPIRPGTGGSVWAAVRSVWRRLRHPRDRTTVSFLVLPDRVFVAEAGWLRLDCRTVLSLTRVGVRELVKDWHEAAGDWFRSGNDFAAQQACEAAARAAQNLSDRLGLTEGLARLPGRVTRLTIVPDDALHGFPFAALPFGHRYLLDRFAVRVAYEHVTPPQARPRVRQTRPVAISVSQAAIVPLVGGGVGRADELPCADAETRWLGRWFHRFTPPVVPVILTDQLATKMAVLAALAEAGIAHAACHGEFFPDAPGASGLVLAADSPGADNALSAEILTIRELVDRAFPRLQHVTLSSCWAADGFVTPGRWVISLPETLCRIGVGSVLANLWRVDDEVGYYFIRRFYHHARRLTRDEAVRRAQVDVRDRLPGRLRGPHGVNRIFPFDWAGYQLYGDPSRIRF